MRYDVDIVVLSDISKELGPDIEIKVGLPTKDPWSLPFGHKQLFADRIDEYDLFIYSEDDTLITQQNIDAFLQVTPVLPDNEIAGFLRYEADADGSRYCSTMHAYYHWVPDSVKPIDGYTFAYCTNEHTGCYALTREQLRKAIGSGGFLVPPHQGRYDLLCTAATDPYTQCGFTKVVCISQMNDFLVHHMSNQYIGSLGLPLTEMEAQIAKLLQMNNGEEEKSGLFATRTTLNTSKWDKVYYEKCRNDVLELVPRRSKRVLSVGCGWGATEAPLIQRGADVVGVPLDSIVAESAKARGIHILPPDFREAKRVLTGETFDCILFVDVLQHVAHPEEVLSAFADLLEEDGYIIVAVPNFKYMKYFSEKKRQGRVVQDANSFEKIRLHFTTPKMVAEWLKHSSSRVVTVKYNVQPRFASLARASFGLLSRYFSPEMLFVAAKS
jgi:2-polyprenyl-3-methyl-5-hydroxy-6-metoxy-1,4-benzoquinol methylase